MDHSLRFPTIPSAPDSFNRYDNPYQPEVIMRTFVVMSKLCPQGPSLVEVAAKMQSLGETGRQWIKDVKEQCPEVHFLAHYALLGPYDFMDIYEAPDEESAAKVSLLCSADRMFQVESWTAIPDKKLALLMSSLKRRKTDHLAPQA